LERYTDKYQLMLCKTGPISKTNWQGSYVPPKKTQRRMITAKIRTLANTITTLRATHFAVLFTGAAGALSAPLRD
jgi:hypothetical protein